MISKFWHALTKPRHQHSWVYGPKTGTGWGLAKCSECGKEDLW